MALIDDLLTTFKTARYGEDVRDAFVECIKKIHDENGQVVDLKNEIKQLTEQFELTSEQLQQAVTDALAEYKRKYEAVKEVAEAAESTANGAEATASNAVFTAEEALDQIGTAVGLTNQLDSKVQSMQLVLNDKLDGAYVENGYLWLTSDGVEVVGPLGPFSGGGGGGGSAGNNAVLQVSNTAGWLSKTVAGSDKCPIGLNWSSIEDGNATGNGTLKVTVNGIVKAVIDIAQGPISVDVSPYLLAGSNVIELNVSDIYNNNRAFNFSVTVVKISISSPFDSSGQFSGAISFPYVPVGQTSKTVHIKLDGTEIGTVETPVSGRQMSYTIPAQTHGAHKLECYFTAVINGQEVESNHLHFELICIQPLNLTPIITSNFAQTEVNQYSTVQIEYQVYDPSSLTAAVSLKDGDTEVQSITVDRQKQIWSYRADTTGSKTLKIVSGGVTKTITFTVKEVQMDIEAETNGLDLYLSSYGRSNGEANPAKWTHGTTTTTFTDFNFISDGWVQDEDGITVLRLHGDARLTINFKPFAEDCRTSGKTLEFEFATRDVRDYDAALISCMSGNRGLKITAQEATLKSEQSSITKQYKDDEHIRVAFVISKRTANRLIYMYIDGVLSGVVQYPDGDDFSQLQPVGITCGSSDCTLDLYCIRVYDHDLSRVQVLNNWICDCQNGVEMLQRYSRNNVYDAYGQISISKLPKDLPYMVLEAQELPQFKGDKKTISGSYTDPVNGAKSFTFEGASANVQGTSSQYYSRKNYKTTFKNGFVTVSGTLPGYALRQGAIPVDTFTFKADVASSEGANNVELVRLYNEACPYKTPPQLENAAIRQGIDGFPMVVFHNDGEKTSFLGKYNFNNDKGTENVYGFAEGDESWETLNNTSDRALFKGWSNASWTDDFEGRYPDGSEEITNLKSFVQRVSGWTNPTKADIEAIAEKQSALFYYLFTELFLMVDSRAKNAFPTRFTGGKWCWLPYDFDTAIGINNEGQYVFSYDLETGDKLEGGADVFNGEGHKFWYWIKQLYQTELGQMYETLRSTGALSFSKVRQMFDDHQSKWPEAIFNEDSQFKYLDPLIVDHDAGYLTMLQGSKKSVRDWWLYHRFLYMDSKYNVADNQTSVITVRGYAKADLTVTPYADMYVNLKYGSSLVSTRGKRNTAYLMACPLDNVNDTETYFYGANMIKKIDGLPAYQVGYANFAAGTKLQEIVLGSADSTYSNTRLNELHLGDLKLLKKIDCRNCSALGTGTMATIDASGCSQIEEIYMDGTAITGIDLPNGGQLKKLHLPSTITSLVIKNQQKITDLTIPSYAGITTLILENVSSVINPVTTLDNIASNARIRLVGFDLGTKTVAELDAFMTKLDGFRGIDDNGNTTDKAQVSGKVHIGTVTGAQMATWKQRYPYITVTYDHLTAYIKYYSEDGSTLLHTETVTDGADATYAGTSSKSSTAQYTYTFDGWSSTPGGTLWANAKKAVTKDRNVYAHFTATVRKYTVYFYNGGTLLQTVQNVPYGSSASYTGSTPVDPSGNAQPFQGWNPSPTNIRGNTSCYAQYIPMYTCTFKNGDTVLYTVKVQKGSTAVYSGATPTDSSGNNKPFIGWDKGLTNIQADTTFNAVFFDFEETITDSWETIISNINSAATGAACGYSVGATKVLDFGGDFGQVAMQLVAVDMDNLTSGGKAKTTWLAKQIGATSKRMNPAFAKNSQTVTKNSWLLDTTNNWYKTNTQNTSSSTAEITFVVTPSETGTLKIGYKVGSEANHDKLTIKVDGTAVVSDKSGSIDWTDHEVEVTSGTAITVEATYTKDNSGDQNGDTCYIKFSGAAHTLQTTVTSVTGSADTSIKNGTGAIGGWQDSEMRTYVKGLKANLPAAVKNAIKDVTKTTQAYRAKTDDPLTSESYTQTTTDDLWIPCYNEMFNSSSAVKYTGFFTNDASRKKYKVGATSSYYWWLRYAYGETVFRCVDIYGNHGGNVAAGTSGVVPGFCI